MQGIELDTRKGDQACTKLFRNKPLPLNDMAFAKHQPVRAHRHHKQDRP